MEQLVALIVPEPGVVNPAEVEKVVKLLKQSLSGTGWGLAGINVRGTAPMLTSAQSETFRHR